MKKLDHKLLKDFKKGKEYAHVYMEEVLNAHISTQIKVLREQNGWTQNKLAEKAEMQQARISVLENVNYSSWSINTLRKLARAFDLVLWVSFENFSVGLQNFENLSREFLQRTPRTEELFVYQDDEPVMEVHLPPATVNQTQEEILLVPWPVTEPLFHAAASTAPWQKPAFPLEAQKQSQTQSVA